MIIAIIHRGPHHPAPEARPAALVRGAAPVTIYYPDHTSAVHLVPTTNIEPRNC